LAYSYEQILQAQFEVAQAEHASANAALEDARMREDPHDVQAAVDRIIANNTVVQQLNQAVATMQRPGRMPADFAGLTREQTHLAIKAGLSGTEAQIALNATGDPKLHDADKMQMYAEGKQRYQEWRASNPDERDFQGRVRR
jgi:hypothetical protein